MARIRLGGMSISEGHSQLYVTGTNGGNVLSDVCSSLGANRINITLLTHLAENGNEACGTAPCLENADGFFGSFLLKRGEGAVETVYMRGDLCIITLFPHERRPGVAGTLLELLSRLEVLPHGLASSPSSLSVLVPSGSLEKVVYGLFDAFEFPPTRSPSDWGPGCRGNTGVIQEVRCSYEERIIKVYHFSRQSELDLWSVTLPQAAAGDLGSLFIRIGDLFMGLFFAVAQVLPEGRLRLGFCVASARSREMEECLVRYLPGSDFHQHRSVTTVYVQGPHFGDRHGITRVLSDALRQAHVAPLALSCAVSSISLVVSDDEVQRAVDSLGTHFQVPS